VLAGLALCFAAVSAGAVPTPTPVSQFTWAQTLSGSSTFGYSNEVARSAAFDKAGHVVTAGATIGLLDGSPVKTFTVAKWSPNGEREWVRTLPSSPVGDDTAWAVVTDEDDHVVAAGSAADLEGDSQFTVARWDSEGNSLWRTTLDMGGFRAAIAFAVALAPNGDIVAAGIAGRNEGSGDLAVVRLAADSGEVKWTKRIGVEGQVSWARTVAVDRKGHVLVGGNAPGNDGAAGACVMKLNGADGELLWSQDLTTGRADLDGIRAVRLNYRGDVIAGGAIQGRFTVLRLNSETGGVRWSRAIQGPAGPGVGEALSVAVDKNGHAVVGGYSSDSVFTVAKIHGESGVPLWTRMHLGAAPDYRLFPGRANAVVVDQSGRVTAVGYRIDTSRPDTSLMAQSWDASGRPLGTRYLDGDSASPTDEEGLAAAVNPAGDVAVAGSIVNAVTGVDFAVAYVANETEPRLRASRNRIAFSPTRVGSQRTEHLVVTNTGHAVWHGIVESPGDGFTVGIAGEPPPPGDTVPRTVTIEPGKRLRLEIGFVPTTPGTHAGKLRFEFDGAGFARLEIGVRGIARAAPAR